MVKHWSWRGQYLSIYISYYLDLSFIYIYIYIDFDFDSIINTCITIFKYFYFFHLSKKIKPRINKRMHCELNSGHLSGSHIDMTFLLFRLLYLFKMAIEFRFTIFAILILYFPQMFGFIHFPFGTIFQVTLHCF